MRGDALGAAAHRACSCDRLVRCGAELAKLSRRTLTSDAECNNDANLHATIAGGKQPLQFLLLSRRGRSVSAQSAAGMHAGGIHV